MPRPITFADACRQYTRRYTQEHIPAWARQRVDTNGRYYAPQFATDREWYENTVFPGEADIPARARHCNSTPTWPLGQWLDGPLDAPTGGR